MPQKKSQGELEVSVFINEKALRISFNKPQEISENLQLLDF